VTAEGGAPLGAPPSGVHGGLTEPPILQPDVSTTSGPLRYCLCRQRGGDSPLPAMRQFMYGRSGTHLEDQVLE
jgi:hypothetical protein